MLMKAKNDKIEAKGDSGLEVVCEVMHWIAHGESVKFKKAQLKLKVTYTYLGFSNR